MLPISSRLISSRLQKGLLIYCLTFFSRSFAMQTLPFLAAGSSTTDSKGDRATAEWMSSSLFTEGARFNRWHLPCSLREPGCKLGFFPPWHPPLNCLSSTCYMHQGPLPPLATALGWASKGCHLGNKGNAPFLQAGRSHSWQSPREAWINSCIFSLVSPNQLHWLSKKSQEVSSILDNVQAQRRYGNSQIARPFFLQNLQEKTFPGVKDVQFAPFWGSFFDSYILGCILNTSISLMLCNFGTTLKVPFKIVAFFWPQETISVTDPSFVLRFVEFCLGTVCCNPNTSPFMKREELSICRCHHKDKVPNL